VADNPPVKGCLYPPGLPVDLLNYSGRQGRVVLVKIWRGRNLVPNSGRRNSYLAAVSRSIEIISGFHLVEVNDGLDKDMGGGIVFKLEVGRGGKNSGVNSNLIVLFVIGDAVIMGLSFNNWQTGFQSGAEESGGNLQTPPPSPKTVRPCLIIQAF